MNNEDGLQLVPYRVFVAISSATLKAPWEQIMSQSPICSQKLAQCAACRSHWPTLTFASYEKQLCFSSLRERLDRPWYLSLIVSHLLRDTASTTSYLFPPLIVHSKSSIYITFIFYSIQGREHVGNETHMVITEGVRWQMGRHYPLKPGESNDSQREFPAFKHWPALAGKIPTITNIPTWKLLKGAQCKNKNKTKISKAWSICEH